MRRRVMRFTVMELDAEHRIGAHRERHRAQFVECLVLIATLGMHVHDADDFGSAIGMRGLKHQNARGGAADLGRQYDVRVVVMLVPVVMIMVVVVRAFVIVVVIIVVVVVVVIIRDLRMHMSTLLTA